MLDHKKTILNVIGLVLVCALVIGSIFLGVYFWPFMIAIIFAVLLEGSINYVVKKTSASRKVVGIIFVVMLYIIIGLLAFLIISTVINEIISLSTKVPEIYMDIEEKYTDTYENVISVMKNMPEIVINTLYTKGLELLDGAGNIAKGIVQGVINFVLFFPNLIIYIIVTFLATLFLVTDKRVIARYFQEVFPKDLFKKIEKVIKACFSTLGKYLKAQCIIICITFSELLIAMLILKQPYPFLLALLIAIIDALPILGTGTVLIPWAIISAITGNIGMGIALLVTYIIITIVRQLVEPRIVSAKLGIHPFITLIAMYLGFKIFGLIGMIIGPVVMIIFKNVFEIMLEEGYLKKIFVYKK